MCMYGREARGGRDDSEQRRRPRDADDARRARLAIYLIFAADLSSRGAWA